MRVKVAVLVSGGGTNLQALHRCEQAAVSSGEIAFVHFQPQGRRVCPGARARARGVETAVPSTVHASRSPSASG